MVAHAFDVLIGKERVSEQQVGVGGEIGRISQRKQRQVARRKIHRRCCVGADTVRFLVTIKREVEPSDRDDDHDLVVKYKLEVVDHVSLAIIERVVTSSVILIQLQVGKHAEHIIDNCVLVDLVVQLREGGEGAVDGGEVGRALDVHHLDPSREVQVEEAVVVAGELLHLIEHRRLQVGKTADHRLPGQVPQRGGVAGRGEGVLGDVVVAVDERLSAVLRGVGVRVVVGDRVDGAVGGRDGDQLREVADPAAQELAVLPLQEDVQVFVAVVRRSVRVDLHDRQRVASRRTHCHAGPPAQVKAGRALTTVVVGELRGASGHGGEAEAGGEQLGRAAGGAESVELRAGEAVVIGPGHQREEESDKQYGNLFFHLYILEIAIRTFASSSEIAL